SSDRCQLDFYIFSKINYYLLDRADFLFEKISPHTYPTKKRKYPNTKILPFCVGALYYTEVNEYG
ncbi:hypothetical protein CN285_27195, partial [Bacillus cereus]